LTLEKLYAVCQSADSNTVGLYNVVFLTENCTNHVTAPKDAVRCHGRPVSGYIAVEAMALELPAKVTIVTERITCVLRKLIDGGR